MGSLLADPCCLLGLGAAGLVAVGTIAALVRGGQRLIARLRSKRAESVVNAVNER